MEIPIEIEVKNGLLYAKYLVDEIDLEVAERAVKQRLDFQEGKEYIGVFDSTNLKIIRNDARKDLSQPIAYKGLLAAAFIIKSPIGAVLGNFYLSFGKFPIPTKLFRQEKQALEWIASLKL